MNAEQALLQTMWEAAWDKAVEARRVWTLVRREDGTVETLSEPKGRGGSANQTLSTGDRRVARCKEDDFSQGIGGDGEAHVG